MNQECARNFLYFRALGPPTEALFSLIRFLRQLIVLHISRFNEGTRGGGKACVLAKFVRKRFSSAARRAQQFDYGGAKIPSINLFS